MRGALGARQCKRAYSGVAAWNSAVFSLVHTCFTTDVKMAMRQASVYNDASSVVLFASPLSCTETAVDDVSSLLGRSLRNF